MFVFSTLRLIACVVAVSALALTVSPTFAGSNLTPFPETDSGAYNGAAVTVTNTQNFLGTGNPRPFAIQGLGTGTTAGGVLGQTNNTNGIGVSGINSSTGVAGRFLLSGAAADSGSAAL
jgi:hypothetical protein